MEPRIGGYWWRPRLKSNIGLPIGMLEQRQGDPVLQGPVVWTVMTLEQMQTDVQLTNELI